MIPKTFGNYNEKLKKKIQFQNFPQKSLFHVFHKIVSYTFSEAIATNKKYRILIYLPILTIRESTLNSVNNVP